MQSTPNTTNKSTVLNFDLYWKVTPLTFTNEIMMALQHLLHSAEICMLLIMSIPTGTVNT